MKMKIVYGVLVGVIAVLAAGVSRGEKESGWRDLFDGKSLAGWRGYQLEKPSPGWKVEDGVMACIPEKGKTTDLITEEQFDDFELVVEWKIEEGGNSGILYRASEEGKKIWHSCIEIQILDNDNHKGAVAGGGVGVGAGVGRGWYFPGAWRWRREWG